MSDYFRHARTAHRSLNWARKGAPVPVGPNLGISRDGIRFLDPIQAARNPATWIGAFQAAIDADTTVSEEALSCIQQHVDRYRADAFFGHFLDRWTNDPQAIPADIRAVYLDACRAAVPSVVADEPPQAEATEEVRG